MSPHFNLEGGAASLLTEKDLVSGNYSLDLDKMVKKYATSNVLLNKCIKKLTSFEIPISNGPAKESLLGSVVTYLTHYMDSAAKY